MKVTLTKLELLQILTAHFNITVTDLVISKNYTGIVNNFLGKMAKELGLATVPEHGFSPEQKIPAIKALRNVTKDGGMYGLAEAKWAVENWPRFIKEYTRLGHLPVLGGSIYSEAGPTIT